MKHVLLLLLALIVVPAWAADAAPVPASKEASAPAAQPAAKAEAQKPKAKKQKAKKHKAKKIEKAATSALVCPTNCYASVCGGITTCNKKKPAPLCTSC